MRINKKILISVIIVVLLIFSLVIYKVMKKNELKTDYYYNYVNDDNKVTQSVRIYDKKGKLQTNYYIIYNDEPVSYTKGEKAVVTINSVDLSKKMNIFIAFEEDINKKYEVSYKK